MMFDKEPNPTQPRRVTASSSLPEESMIKTSEIGVAQHHLHQLDEALKIIKTVEAESDEMVARNDYIALIDAEQQKQQADDTYLRSWEWLIERGDISFDHNTQQHILSMR